MRQVLVSLSLEPIVMDVRVLHIYDYHVQDSIHSANSLTVTRSSQKSNILEKPGRSFLGHDDTVLVMCSSAVSERLYGVPVIFNLCPNSVTS